MKKIEIKHRWTSAVLFTADVEDDDLFPMRTALRQAIDAKANLSSANLRSADLSSADLSSADLRWADLSSADLSSANLRSADLRWANLRSADLRWANLSSANLRSADLRWANLSSANLRSADLSSADLRWADLSSADLSSANLSWIREDIRSILDLAPAEVPTLLAKLRAGEVDGSVYEGECACLVGTIANARGCEYTKLAKIEPDSSRPAERFFMGIVKGSTPDNNGAAAAADDIICEWLAERGEGPWMVDEPAVEP